MSIRKGNDIIASKPTIDSSVTSGSPNAVSGGGVYTALQSKQNNLVAGQNVTISGSTISAKDTTYTAGENITIESTGTDDYTLLEYIQSNGTQYIDTGVTGLDSGNWLIYMKWMLVSAPTTSYSYVIGAYNGETYNTYRIITKQTSSTGYYVNGNSAAGSGSVLADNYAANVIHEAYIRNGSVTVDSTTYTTSTQGTTIPSNVHLFLLGNASVGRTSSRIYESWAKQNGIEKYHYYPAMRNSDNAIGMYDTVGQRFVSATAGTFAAGPVKSDGYIIRGKNWSVSDLTDASITNATAGDVLQYDGTDWVNTDITDTTTITQNSSNKIQAIGTVNKNQAQGSISSIYDWVGTLSEYTTQQIETLHPEWVCYITDDHTATAYEAYSRTQSDSRYYQKTETYSQNETDALLNGKVNVNANNFTQVGTTYLSGLGMPSNTNVEDITVLATNEEYTAPANGWFQAIGTAPSSGNSYLLLVVNNTTLYEKRQIIRTGNFAGPCGVMMPVLAGEEVVLAYSMTDIKLRFFYAEGNPMPVNP